MEASTEFISTLRMGLWREFQHGLPMFFQMPIEAKHVQFTGIHLPRVHINGKTNTQRPQSPCAYMNATLELVGQIQKYLHLVNLLRRSFRILRILGTMQSSYLGLLSTRITSQLAIE
uniref:Uncharacterized protein n=1 Tax=Opuntia streptacantha TaxID=393608 RepID=A0A7C9EUG9_OPUST